MRHNDVIYLIKRTVEYDELGNQIETEEERMVYANEMSISINEFYQAGGAGYKPEKQFEIYSFEYDGETDVRHNGKRYKIVRVAKKGDKTRIICESMMKNKNKTNFWLTPVYRKSGKR